MANDGKMKELWEKMRKAEKWADEHEYQKLINQISKLREEKESYFRNKMGSHPQVHKIEQELAELERKMKMFKDDDATEHGSIETYGKEKETETMPLEKNPVQAQDKAIHDNRGNNIGYVQKEGNTYAVYLNKGEGNLVRLFESNNEQSAINQLKEYAKRYFKDEEPTNAVKDSYDMLKLCGIVS